MVGRFAIRNFCSGFLHGKMTAWFDEGETDDLLLGGGPLDVLEVCDNVRGVWA